ncbi:MerR family transcriptional regulator [Hoeflea sp. Naph1]|uniref:MerR family transcriptional regulator n=1 Tax=Hoeflea sp. Naph1 TaxID=3388653 RepID=UPI00398FFC63
MHFTVATLARSLAVDESTVRTWVQISKSIRPISRRVGGKRVFDTDDTLAIAMAVSLLRLGVPVSPEVLAEIIPIAFSGQRSGSVTIRSNGAASVTIDLAAALATIKEQPQ